MRGNAGGSSKAEQRRSLQQADGEFIGVIVLKEGWQQDATERQNRHARAAGENREERTHQHAHNQPYRRACSQSQALKILSSRVAVTPSARTKPASVKTGSAASVG